MEGKDDGLYYEYFPAGKPEGFTFVFYNAIISDTKSWEAFIAPELRSLGHGTLTFNYRGQIDSPFSEGVILDENLIVTVTLLFRTINCVPKIFPWFKEW